MAYFKVTMKETWNDHTLTQYANVPNEKEVIKIYGLDEPDIEWYEIEEVDRFSDSKFKESE